MDVPDESGGGEESEGLERKMENAACKNAGLLCLMCLFSFKRQKSSETNKKGRNTITLNYRCEVKCRFRHSQDLQPQSKRERARE